MGFKIKNGGLVPIQKPKVKPSELVKPHFACANDLVATEFYDKQSVIVIQRNKESQYTLLTNDEISALYSCLRMYMTQMHPEIADDGFKRPVN